MNTLQAHKNTIIIWLLAAISMMLVAALLTSVITNAWGPSERKTFTMEKPASYVTFNSMTNNTDHGDERDFVHAKPATHTAANGWKDTVNVKPGEEYLVRIYVHNDAAKNLNKVAQNTRAFADVPSGYSKSATVTGEVRADNAVPQRVWDETTFKGSSNFRLAYVKGSATYTNNVFTSGTKISDNIVAKDGALLGYDKLDGKIPGCLQYSGWVMFKVVAQSEKSSQFTVEKKVRKSGDSKWNRSVNAKPGDKLEYLIGYKNIGNTVQSGVNIFDKLPKGISFVDGSAKLTNSSHKDGKNISGDSLVNKGLDIGKYDTGANAYVQFAATVNTTKDLACGQQTLRNFGHASVDGETKQDHADAVIEAECAKDECKPGIPEGDDRCEDEVIPAALPTTGPAQMIAGVLGVALVSLGVAYWIRSRQEYRKVLAGTDSVTEPAIGTLGAAVKAQSEEVDATEPSTKTIEKKANHSDTFHK